jgi:membrane protease YdiL (CAAX protease family)
MPEAANIGILQDVTCIAAVAMFLGLIGYRLMRLLRPNAAWNHEGLVISRPYVDADLVVMTAGLGMLLLGIMRPVAQAVAEPEALPDAGVIALGMVFNLLLCVVLLLYLHRVRGLSPAELFGFTLIRWRTVARVVALFIVPMLIVVGIVAQLANHWLQGIAPGAEEQELVKIFTESDSFGLRFIIIVAAVIIAPIAEETLFRGFIYGVLKRYTDGPFAAIVSGLFFALIHMHVGSLVPLWVLAIIFCAAYELTGCLLVPMLLHAIFNGTSVLIMIFATK